MSKYKFFLSDFVEIQRKSFRDFLQKGFIDEFYKRNPITNNKKNIEIFFYPEYYQLTVPDLNPRNAIIKGKSYSSKIFIPVQLTDKKNKKIFFQWAFLGNLPIMTKRGHFILNGAARVIVNQILRSPGIYYHEKIYFNDQISAPSYPPPLKTDNQRELASTPHIIPLIGSDIKFQPEARREKINFTSGLLVNRQSNGNPIASSGQGVAKPSNNPQECEPREGNKPLSDLLSPALDNLDSSREHAERVGVNNKESKNTSFKRFYADIICVKGTWLRIEIDKDRRIWAQMKKIQKIPIFWFLMAMGLTEKIIFNSIIDSTRIDLNLNIGFTSSPSRTKIKNKINYPYVQTPPEAWREIFFLLQGQTNKSSRFSDRSINLQSLANSRKGKFDINLNLAERNSSQNDDIDRTEKKAFVHLKKKQEKINKLLTNSQAISNGRKWIFNRFLNPRTYDLGNFGRYALNKKLGLSISKNQTTLTSQDILKATDYLIKIENGLKKIDDIDNLKNKRVRTSGELLQIQIATGLLRLEKVILDKINNPSKGVRSRVQRIFFDSVSDTTMASFDSLSNTTKVRLDRGEGSRRVVQGKALHDQPYSNLAKQDLNPGRQSAPFGTVAKGPVPREYTNNPAKTLLTNLINRKVFNSSLKEFFGTSPLSQFMDQINPLAEITHKRRLTAMGPGGVSRDSATLAIRGIHPTHYGRICPIETPEGKNTGLVNSMTTFARVNEYGLIETPFYKVYKGQVQKNTGMFYFASEYEEKIKVATPDLLISKVGFLPKSQNPVRIVEDFTKISRKYIEYIGVSSIQMISIGTSLIPFLEHDDALRALMGSNMQRQAVPLIRPERPIVTTGLESRVVSDSGQAVQARKGGLVTFASAEKIIVLSFS